ncbi:hypothetical protein K435DRAFT_860175 [Dendrothele bispora CBS 962.96]|uniref:Uncharacterized protein n=1 Tax=Dendrothele bispora (strain CBS 962.96) TaxID=1314807 RepID=A0A4S8LYX0_DENBC|nr:hypothetical protein K435DRAFT_860175 [Dendrothele bispora CBS 962.96]
MPCQPKSRDRTHATVLYSRQHDVPHPKSTNSNSSGNDPLLITPQQLEARSRGVMAARHPFIARRRPVIGNPQPIDDRELMMIYHSIETNNYPKLFTPRQPDYLARYEILIAMYPAAHGLRGCKRTGYDHLISITSSGTLTIKCHHCNVAGLCNAIPAKYQHEFDKHFARWEKFWEEDKPRREALAEMFRMVDEDLI